MRTRATAPPPDEHFRKVGGGGDPAVLGPSVAAGARRLAATLRDAGPDATMWTPVPAGRRSSTRAGSRTRPLFTGPMRPWPRARSSPSSPRSPSTASTSGWTACRRCSSSSPTGGSYLTETLAWRRAHEKAAVAVRGPLTDLLLLVYRRRGLDGAGLEVFGDRALLEFWLARVGFG